MAVGKKNNVAYEVPQILSGADMIQLCQLAKEKERGHTKAAIDDPFHVMEINGQHCLVRKNGIKAG